MKMNDQMKGLVFVLAVFRGLFFASLTKARQMTRQTVKDPPKKLNLSQVDSASFMQSAVGFPNSTSFFSFDGR